MTQQANTEKAPASSQNERVLRPLVSIVESPTGFTLTAELPGVPKDGVAVSVENNVLTLSGKLNLNLPEGMTATYAEVQNARYQRAFTLSRDLDSSKIAAQQKDGVLTLTIPKREAAVPQKIQVQVG